MKRFSGARHKLLIGKLHCKCFVSAKVSTFVDINRGDTLCLFALHFEVHVIFMCIFCRYKENMTWLKTFLILFLNVVAQLSSSHVGKSQNHDYSCTHSLRRHFILKFWEKTFSTFYFFCTLQIINTKLPKTSQKQRKDYTTYIFKEDFAANCNKYCNFSLKINCQTSSAFPANHN